MLSRLYETLNSPSQTFGNFMCTVDNHTFSQTHVCTNLKTTVSTAGQSSVGAFHVEGQVCLISANSCNHSQGSIFAAPMRPSSQETPFLKRRRALSVIYPKQQRLLLPVMSLTRSPPPPHRAGAAAHQEVAGYRRLPRQRARRQMLAPVGRVSARRRLCPTMSNHHLLLYLLLLMTCEIAGAKYCYVGQQNGRVYDTTQEAIECSAVIYGDNAACAFACARDSKAKTDVCSFLCIPGQHCNNKGQVHPVSQVSPSNFLPGCGRQENFEVVEEGQYDCVSRCCPSDRCNANSSMRMPRSSLSTSALVAAGIAAPALLFSL